MIVEKHFFWVCAAAYNDKINVNRNSLFTSIIWKRAVMAFWRISLFLFLRKKQKRSILIIKGINLNNLVVHFLFAFHSFPNIYIFSISHGCRPVVMAVLNYVCSFAGSSEHWRPWAGAAGPSVQRLQKSHRETGWYSWATEQTQTGDARAHIHPDWCPFTG